MALRGLLPHTPLLSVPLNWALPEPQQHNIAALWQPGSPSPPGPATQTVEGPRAPCGGGGVQKGEAAGRRALASRVGGREGALQARAQAAARPAPACCPDSHVEEPQREGTAPDSSSVEGQGQGPSAPGGQREAQRETLRTGLGSGVQPVRRLAQPQAPRGPRVWDSPELGTGAHRAVGEGPLTLPHLLGQQAGQGGEVDPWNSRGQHWACVTAHLEGRPTRKQPPCVPRDARSFIHSFIRSFTLPPLAGQTSVSQLPL